VRSLDAADLVVIAGRTLGIGTDAALAQLDITAAQAALAEAGTASREPSAAAAGDRAAAAAACARLVHALLSHRAFPRHCEQVAVAAGLQFLSLNGWQADLDPPATAAVVVEALAAGQLAPDAVAAWLAPRLSLARPIRLAPVPVSRRGTWAPRRRSAPRVPVGRLVASALLAVTVSGVGVLAAACSRAPDVPAAPAGVAPAAITACVRSHSVEYLPYRSAGAATQGYGLLRC
jgi:hypothetical protein